MHLAQAVETVAALRTDAKVAALAVELAPAPSAHPLSRHRIADPEFRERTLIVGELDDVLVVVVALEIDRSYRHRRAEIVDDVGVGVGQHRRVLRLPDVPGPRHDAVGDPLAVGHARTGDRRLAGE